MNSAITAVYSFVLVTAAAWFLQSTWRDGAEDTWFLPSFLRARWPFASEGVIQHGAEKQWLDVNPFVWLALRDKRPVRLAWLATSLVVVLWFTGFAFWPRAWGTLSSAMVGSVAMGGIVGLMAMLSAAMRFAADRRSGALELLLTTPLSIEQIVQGQRQALWVAFRPLLWCWLGVSVVVALSSAAVRTWDVLALVVDLECWGVLTCLVLISLRSQTVSQVIWAALNCGRPILVLRKVVCPPGVLVAFGFFIYSIVQTGWPKQFPQGSPGELSLVSCILLGTVILSALAGHWDPSTRRLKREFRWIAQRPVPEPSDPRLRHWDATKPFPERDLSGLFLGR